ncbi:MAG: cytochrome c oxidase accessory protein CcoG [Planctomycetota bacterium]
MSGPELPVLAPEERVLSTLESDGTRRWLSPRLSTGRFWRRRRVVAYALIAIYALLPFIKVGGRPALQLDLWNAKFSVFGLVITPTELELAALLGLVIVLAVFFATAIFGRVWCGWACPQTVYMEYVFRPIERLFTGTTGKGGKPRQSVAPWRSVAMYAVMTLVCWHLANTFLAYFVGAEALHQWIWTAPPWEHPGAFALVFGVTALMMFDFCYWREQLCIIGCPYGRFQSVLLDRSSLVVGYDSGRGEPRGRGRERNGKGDCVDCGMCVDVCPTGIDIRDGLQMECVNCTQCIDACDAVMDKVGRPRGLIRYSSQEGLDGKPTKIVRPRVLAYGGVICAVSVLLISMVVGRSSFDVTVMRGLGRAYFVADSGDVQNLVQVKVTNRLDEPQAFKVEGVFPAGMQIIGDTEINLEPLADATEPLQLVVNPSAFGDKTIVKAVIRVSNESGESSEYTYTLYGPIPGEQAEADDGGDG